MNKLQKFSAALLLSSTLSLPSLAGQIEIGSPQPAPTPEEVTTANGNMHTGYSDEATAGEAVVAGALSLLQGVWSLL